MTGVVRTNFSRVKNVVVILRYRSHFDVARPQRKMNGNMLTMKRNRVTILITRGLSLHY
jgi:hypothetical protein